LIKDAEVTLEMECDMIWMFGRKNKARNIKIIRLKTRHICSVAFPTFDLVYI
jgi:hypothetical protein